MRLWPDGIIDALFSASPDGQHQSITQIKALDVAIKKYVCFNRFICFSFFFVYVLVFPCGENRSFRWTDSVLAARHEFILCQSESLGPCPLVMAGENSGLASGLHAPSEGVVKLLALLDVSSEDVADAYPCTELLVPPWPQGGFHDNKQYGPTSSTSNTAACLCLSHTSLSVLLCPQPHPLHLLPSRSCYR